MPDPMPDPRNKELDQDSQDSKSHNSQKQKQVASDDDGGTGGDGVGSSSSGSSSQSSSTSHLDEDSASSLQPASNQQLPSRFSPVNSLGPSIRRGPANGQDAGSDPADEMKKLEPMAELPPINGNFYPDGGPGIQGANINNGMLMPRFWNGDMVDGSKQPIWVIASPVLNLSPTGGINPFGDVYVSKADDVSMALFYGEDVPQEP